MKKKLSIKNIVIKAIKDKEFYKELKKNPKKVLEKISKEKLPKNLKVKIIDQKENELYLVIPKIFDKKSLEKEQLKKIHAGHAGFEFELPLEVTDPIEYCRVHFRKTIDTQSPSGYK